MYYEKEETYLFSQKNSGQLLQVVTYKLKKEQSNICAAQVVTSNQLIII
jgi:hypothetical protein